MRARPARPGRRRWTWAIGASVLAAMVAADRAGWLLVRPFNDHAAYDRRRVTVSRVIDGDTIEIAARDGLHDHATTRVRLLGIDCPEMAGYGRAAEPWAEEATAFAAALVEGRSVILRLERAETRGLFGRLLAHIELEDGNCLNEALLTAGLAEAEERWPHSRLRRYAALAREARLRGLGIWSGQNP